MELLAESTTQKRSELNAWRSLVRQQVIDASVSFTTYERNSSTQAGAVNHKNVEGGSLFTTTAMAFQAAVKSTLLG